MKKRITVITTVVMCAVSVAVGADVSGVINDIKAQLRPDFTIEIDGEEKVFKNVNGEVVYPVLYDGTTYLPVRAIGEMMGKTVFWYEDDKTVRLKDTTVTDADVIVSGSKKTDNANSDTTKFIGVDKAKEIALEKAGFKADEVRFDRAEVDEDDGIWHYEIEFRKGFTEYEIDIKADDGTILKWEIDK